MSPEERELERFLARRSSVTQAYAGLDDAPDAEPPNRLDAQVLAAARAAVRAVPPKPVWWRQLLGVGSATLARPWLGPVPVSTAAVMVLAASVVLLMETSPDRLIEPPAPAGRSPVPTAPSVDRTDSATSVLERALRNDLSKADANTAPTGDPARPLNGGFSPARLEAPAPTGARRQVAAPKTLPGAEKGVAPSAHPDRPTPAPERRPTSSPAQDPPLAGSVEARAESRVLERERARETRSAVVPEKESFERPETASKVADRLRALRSRDKEVEAQGDLRDSATAHEAKKNRLAAPNPPPSEAVQGVTPRGANADTSADTTENARDHAANKPSSFTRSAAATQSTPRNRAQTPSQTPAQTPAQTGSQSDIGAPTAFSASGRAAPPSEKRSGEFGRGARVLERRVRSAPEHTAGESGQAADDRNRLAPSYARMIAALRQLIAERRLDDARKMARALLEAHPDRPLPPDIREAFGPGELNRPAADRAEDLQ